MKIKQTKTLFGFLWKFINIVEKNELQEQYVLV